MQAGEVTVCNYQRFLKSSGKHQHAKNYNRDLFLNRTCIYIEKIECAGVYSRTPHRTIKAYPRSVLSTLRKLSHNLDLFNYLFIGKATLTVFLNLRSAYGDLNCQAWSGATRTRNGHTRAIGHLLFPYVYIQTLHVSLKGWQSFQG